MHVCMGNMGKLVFLLACIGLLVATEVRGDEKVAADADDQRILGSWKSTSFERDGKSDPTGVGGKAIFTPEKSFVHGLPGEVKLDASQSPRHFNFGTAKGIYEIRGDWLRICVPSSSVEPRPTAFKTAPGDGCQMIVFKRLAPIDPATPDAAMDADLKKTITGAIASIEGGDIDSLLKTIVPPFALEQLPAEMRPQLVRQVTSQKDPLLKTFATLLKIKPEMNEAGDRAIFDLTNCHIEGGLHFAEVKFAKVGDSWHLVPDR